MDLGGDLDGTGGFGLGGFQMMGIMNALKTGDVRMDMILAMCLPLVLRFLFVTIGRFDHLWKVDTWVQWFFRGKNDHERFITYKSTRSSWGGMTSWDSDTQNTVLLKAIQLYMHHKLNINLPSAKLDLTSMDDKGASLGYYSSDYGDDDEAEGSSSPSRKTLVGVLSKYKIIKKPPENIWHELGSFPCASANDKDIQLVPVKLRIYQEEENVGNDNNARQHCTLTYHFVSTDAAAIDAFVDMAYKWYMEQLKSLEDNSRHLYELKSLSSSSSSNNSDGEDGGSQSSGGLTYTRYKLSDDKTFDSLFFPEKTAILNLIQHFTDKSGKYAIPGYPHKLGLLLHGPPGTGKTSLIKAVAQRTGRSIVNVPLARISTNSELMSIFFDKKYYIQGEDVPVKLGFQDVIFVMEDVDSASRIVRRRDGKKTTDMVQTELVDLPPPKSMWRMLLESSESECQELVEHLISNSDRLKAEATKPEVLRSIARRMTVLPGLGLSEAGKSSETDTSKALEKVFDQALESANTLMDGYSTVDRFVNIHARAIKRLLDAGAEIDDDFVDELLGMSVGDRGNMGLSCLPKFKTTSRDVSYTGIEEEIHLDTDIALVTSITDMMNKKGADEGFSGSKVESARDLIGPLTKSSKAGKDELNLTGLLNVLDGVVDTPGRILIMTTNHPEMLDQALIRPGRIDKRIMLGYMHAEHVVSMLEHYFQTTLSDDQRRRVEVVINGDGLLRPQVRMTPAQVEQLTAEHDEIDDMIQALEAKSCPIGQSYNTRTTSKTTITYS